MSVSSKIAPEMIQSHTGINLARVEDLSPYDFAKCQIRGLRMDGWMACLHECNDYSKQVLHCKRSVVRSHG